LGAFCFAAVGVLHQQRIAHQCLKVKNTFKGEKAKINTTLSGELPNVLVIAYE